MYQTLYRKYRPSTFDEVVGQNVIIKTIKNAIKNNKLSHAYLFNGPRGTGKTSIAKIIAKTINCENPVNLIPCNKCVNCTQLNNKQSIDVIEIDAASNNGVDEIRELKNNVNLVPSTGKYKVYIIDEVHMLTTGAFNALLKTLEEPPAHVIFILATTEPHKIPSTILSRCQKFDFKKIAVDKIVERLNYVIEQENINIESEAIYEIARLSDGGMRDSLSILDQVLAYSDDVITIEDIHEINGTLPQNKLKDFIEAIIDKNYDLIFELIDNYDSNGKNFIKLTDEIIIFLRNIMLLLNAPNYFETIISNEQVYEELIAKIKLEQIIKYINIFNETIVKMKKSSNPRIIFESTIILLLNENIEFKKNESLENTKEDNTVKQISKTNTISKEKTIKKINIDKKQNIDIDLLNNLTKIRINNTLCYFNKKELNDLKIEIEKLRLLLMNPDYSEIISLVFEGTIKAVGNNYIIFVYEDERLSSLFNENIFEIENVFEENLNRKFKLISTYEEDWSKIKNEFNNKLKKYEYIEEPKMEKFEKNQNMIENMFDEVVEYK